MRVLTPPETNTFSIHVSPCDGKCLYLHVFACERMSAAALSRSAYGVGKKGKVNAGAIGLPSFLLPPAKLTVQSEDNGRETNAVCRQSNAPPPWCVCVCLRVRER